MQKEFYVEQLVRRKLGRRGVLIRIASVVGALALVATSWLISPTYCPIIMAAAVIGAYLLYRGQNVDYEYTFLNGDFVVYRITDQRRRAKMLSTNMNKVQVFAPCMPAYRHLMQAYSTVKTVDYTEHNGEENCWFFVFAGTTGQMVCAKLQPSERLLEAMRAYLGDKVRTEHGEWGEAEA